MSTQNTNSLSFARAALIEEFTELGMDRLTSLDLLADAFQTILKHFVRYNDPLATLQMYTTDETKSDVDLFKYMVEGGYICATTALQKGFIDTVYIAKELLEHTPTGDKLVTVLTGFCDIPFFSIFNEAGDRSVNFVDGEVEQYHDSCYWYGEGTYYAGVVRAVDYFFITLSSGDIPKYRRLPQEEVRDHIREQSVFLYDSIIVENDDELAHTQIKLLDDICKRGLGKERIAEYHIKAVPPAPIH